MPRKARDRTTQGVSQDAKSEELDSLEGVKRLIKYWRRGRGIVPLIGAGISVESGIPALSGVVRYLAKVHFFLEHQVYLPPSDAPSEGWKDGLRISTDDYLDAVGWPDLHQLDTDLWRWLQRRAAGLPTDATLMEQVVQISLREELKGREARWFHRLEAEAPIPLKGWLARPACVAEGPRSEAWKDLTLAGDWKSLLGFVTKGDPGRVDALFQQLVRGRLPGTAHRFLAYLARLMDWRLILTLNFDALVEDAMRQEGLKPDVYDVSDEAGMPNAGLLARRLSIVKLHGGMYGLKVGERIDQPLDEESKARLIAALPRDPVILVLGWAGWDRRVMDLVKAILGRRDSDAHPVGAPPEVLWLRFEDSTPERLEELLDAYPEFRGRVKQVQISDLAEFLREAQTRASNAHERSLAYYPPHSQRPLRPSRPSPELEEHQRQRGRIYLFADPDKMRPPEADGKATWKAWFEAHPPSDEGSVAMSAFASLYRATHTQIWVDVESHPTVGGVIEEIFSQIRRRDLLLPPNVVTLGELAQPGLIGTHEDADRDAVRLRWERDLGNAVDRLVQALSRGRYLVALDGVGSFCRPPTIHHGIPRVEDMGIVGSNTELFHDFVARLARAAAGTAHESILCLSLDIPSPRRADGDLATLRDAVRSVARLSRVVEGLDDVKLVGRHGPAEPPLAPLPKPGGGVDLEDVVDRLVAYRRPRSIVALRNILAPDAKGAAEAGEESPGRPTSEEADEDVDGLLKRMEDARWIHRVEGGGYWMSIAVRDARYAAMSADCATTRIRSLLSQRPLDLKAAAATSRNLLRLHQIHDRIARYYYAEYYLASRHIDCLLEYLYHRIASIRFLTMRTALPGTTPDAAGGVATPDHGFQRYDDLRALSRVLRREMSAIFSHIPPDNLYFWIKWIEKHDLPRFELSHFGAPPTTDAGRIEELTRRVCRRIKNDLTTTRLRLLREKTEFTLCVKELYALVAEHLGQLDQLLRRSPNRPPAPTPDDAAFGAYEEYVRSLARTLFDEPGTVRFWKARIVALFDHEWRSARLERMEAVAGASPPLLSDEANGRFLDVPTPPGEVDERERRFVCIAVGRLFELIDVLLDVLHCRKNQNVFAEARRQAELIRDILESLMRFALEEGPHSTDPLGPSLLLEEPWLDKLERMNVRLTFLRADLLVAPYNRWSVKGRPFAWRDLAQAHCEESVELCREGLEKIRSVAGVSDSEYPIYRSYFYTIKARAHALLGQFSKAYSSLDKGAAGLSQDHGVARLSLAVIQLRRAETALIRSDHVILNDFAFRRTRDLEEGFRRRRAVGKSYYRELSTEGMRYLHGQAFHALKRRGEAADDRAVEAFCEDLDHIARALRRSLAHWSGKWLSRIQEDDGGRGLADAIVGARQRLRRAWTSLERARVLIMGARRNVHWWRLLYQSQAQYHFESLLLLVTEPVPPTGLERARARLHLSVLEHLRHGLRAIRDGLDCTLPQARFDPMGLEPRESELTLRERRLLDLWVQFLVVKFTYEGIRQSETTADALRLAQKGLQNTPDAAYLSAMVGAPEVAAWCDGLWECWKHVNAMEAMPDVEGPDADDVPKRFLREAFIDRDRPEACGLKARAYVERQVLRAFRTDDVHGGLRLQRTQNGNFAWAHPDGAPPSIAETPPGG
ncbi:hypothetical protein [Planctomyces sp. SH-PL62]|uniref:hypothetical protein n=1 Tax=Planctomyces sp. SH-PL62 TaxID=1636152 RepID=UPI00078E25AC|nr:hypothetical protein [Planctomyces sp. SH-PL62]AMV37951.1 hypothetical protein VT85_10980 [Planctomyces sp. SH-PL62]